MEIVPILSTIILVGTVATFILAVAAYVLYKIREGGAASDNELAVYQQPHHVVMAVDNDGTMHSMGDSAPSEHSPYYAASANAQSAGAYAEANAGYEAPPNVNMGDSRLRSAAQGQAQSTPLNTFFWSYSENGFSPIDLQGERNGEHHSAPDTDDE